MRYMIFQYGLELVLIQQILIGFEAILETKLFITLVDLHYCVVSAFVVAVFAVAAELDAAAAVLVAASVPAVVEAVLAAVFAVAAFEFVAET